MRKTRSINGDTAPRLMQSTMLFNSELKNIMDQLNNQYSAQIYTMGNSFQPNQDVLNKPQANGNVSSRAFLIINPWFKIRRVMPRTHAALHCSVKLVRIQGQLCVMGPLSFLSMRY
jgi:hypothetical protein